MREQLFLRGACSLQWVPSIVCTLLHDINDWLHIDEGMDVSKLYGIGGMVGAFLAGIFASQSVAALGGATEDTGGIDGNGIRVVKHFAEVYQPCPRTLLQCRASCSTS